MCSLKNFFSLDSFLSDFSSFISSFLFFKEFNSTLCVANLSVPTEATPASGFFKTASKLAFISVAELYLKAGSFCIAFMIIWLTLCGTLGLISDGGSGSCCMCISATETGVSASNGTFPVTISYNTTPNEYKSDLASVMPPFACSGEK